MARPDTGPCQHGPIANGRAWHAVPPGPCLIGPRAWPSAQAQHYGPFFVPCRPAKPDQNYGPCQPTARYPCIHKIKHNQCRKLKMSNTFTDHSFIHSQNQSPNVRYIQSPTEISNSKLQSQQITEITKMSYLVQCCLIKNLSR